MKWIMRYLRGTSNHGLVYGKFKQQVKGYVDSDFVEDLDKRKFISRYLFMLNNCHVNWKATVQHIVALSSIKAEFIAATRAVKKSIWLRGLLNELLLK